MYTPIQIEAVRLFGRKELTEGCLLLNKESLVIYNHSGINSLNNKMYYFDGYEHSYFYKDDLIFFEILGHIPHLEDVFRVAEEKGYNVKYELGELKFFDMKYYGCLKLSVSFQNIPLIDQPALTEIIKLLKND